MVIILILPRCTVYALDEDILIDDTSVLGFPFIIETWNEQPLLIDILDKKLGSISVDMGKVKESDTYTEAQLKFRKEEIRNAAFIQQSVISALSSFESQNKSRIIKMNIIRITSIAAAFIGVLLTVWQPTKLSKHDYFDKYNSTYPNTLNLNYKVGDLVRGGEILIVGFDSNESEIIHLALQKYDSSDFKVASDLLENIPDLKSRNTELFFYYAISNIQIGMVKESVKSLEYLSLINDFKYKSDVLYYLVLSYASMGEETKARNTIKLLNQSDKNYLKDKPNIVKDLRWF